ncbi:hypothetical protein LMG31506_06460 [Cupriavidus yeoncheonensis]|uniref:Uncharacterized protein n=1 Tax=Cupriavidus yeoncheonensis TaxID=1462994 RepID=A0A916J2K8_9BURK|nr:hypothetical protein LMG31506_06460 [Cupriavidus yeoncheonensis]
MTFFSQPSSKRICSSSHFSSQSGSGRRDCTVSFGNRALFTCRLVGCSGFSVRRADAISTPILANAARALSPNCARYFFM